MPTSPAMQATSTQPRPTVTTFAQATETSAIAPESLANSGHEVDQVKTPEPATRSALATIPGMTQIALIKTTDRAEGVRRAMELLNTNPARGEHVFLKPNFNSADPSPGSTHPDTLRALTVGLLNMGARSITVGDRSGMGDTNAVMRQLGVYDLAGELGLETYVFDDLDETDWIIRRSADFHWADGYAVPRILLDSACVVQTCNLKTHQYGGHFTLSLKNSVGFAAKTTRPGGYNYMEELHSSLYQRKMIAEINMAYRPSLIVMDGVEAFVNGGPAQGRKVSSEVILAGTDPIAIDAVGVAILRMFGTTPQVSRGKIFEQEQIARAVELELGVDSPAKIQFLTEDEDSEIYADAIRQQLAI